jgi:diketogulonate reductase-like aldo/keto reductase
MIVACENSLKRLKTDYLDMYLLHWRGTVPLLETIEAFHRLVEEGKVRYWGVSNFDVHDMRELLSLPGGQNVATNQVLYNLAHRGIDYNLMPWCLRHNLPIMAYSPINRGDISHPVLKRIAHRHGPTTTPFQVALAWVLMHEQVIAIPKATDRTHLLMNRQALDLKLTNEDLNELNQAFPSPQREVPLEMI